MRADHAPSSPELAFSTEHHVPASMRSARPASWRQGDVWPWRGLWRRRAPAGPRSTDTGLSAMSPTRSATGRCESFRSAIADELRPRQITRRPRRSPERGWTWARAHEGDAHGRSQSTSGSSSAPTIRAHAAPSVRIACHAFVLVMSKLDSPSHRRVPASCDASSTTARHVLHRPLHGLHRLQRRPRLRRSSGSSSTAWTIPSTTPRLRERSHAAAHERAEPLRREPHRIVRQQVAPRARQVRTADVDAADRRRRAWRRAARGPRLRDRPRGHRVRPAPLPALRAAAPRARRKRRASRAPRCARRRRRRAPAGCRRRRTARRGCARAARAPAARPARPPRAGRA